jgi:hypothetical protein
MFHASLSPGRMSLLPQAFLAPSWLVTRRESRLFLRKRPIISKRKVREQIFENKSALVELLFLSGKHCSISPVS